MQSVVHYALFFWLERLTVQPLKDCLASICLVVELNYALFRLERLTVQLAKGHQRSKSHGIRKSP